MQLRSKILSIGAAVAVAGIATAGAAIAGGSGGENDASDTPITGAPLEQASAAALAHTGGGRVTGTEVGDEESLYEIEVTLGDGSQVDVQLDAAFKVVQTMSDSDTAS